MAGDLSTMRVLITGGTGFIGGRLVERLLLESGAKVRVLVRNFARAPRISRFPIEMLPGDVASPDDVERAAEGCDLIFHCAYGNQGSDERRRVDNVQGSKNVLEAALHNSVKRVIHVSTISVYGETAEGELNEEGTRRYTGAVYGDSKLEAEEMALNFATKRGLPVTVLQPTVVYGPYGSTWTVNVLQQLKTGRVILVDGGDGLCNAVYVDDVISAMLLAATKPEAVGQAFLVSGKEPITWREFYARYERMLGVSRTVSMSLAEAEAYYAEKQAGNTGIISTGIKLLRDPRTHQRIFQTREGAALARAARKILPQSAWQALKRQVKPNGGGESPRAAIDKEVVTHPLHPTKLRFMAAKTRVSIEKARRVLGYEPAFDFEAGMDLTEKWARWANLC